MNTLMNNHLDARLTKAFECVAALVERENTKRLSEIRRNRDGKEQVNVHEFQGLVAICALLSWLDSDGARITNALEEIAESMDILVAYPDDAGEVPTDEERVVIYRALEADYMTRGNPPSIKEIDAALCRFKKLAGL